VELPRRCISALGRAGRDVVVLDPFSGSGTSGLAALSLGCSYLGFEIDPGQVAASNARLAAAGNAPPTALPVPTVTWPFGVAAGAIRAVVGLGRYYPG